MAVKIRFTRVGKKNRAQYRLIVVEEGKKRDGKYIEKIGFYDPGTAPATLTIDKARLDYWISQGARLGAGAARLLKK